MKVYIPFRSLDLLLNLYEKFTKDSKRDGHKNCIKVLFFGNSYKMYEFKIIVETLVVYFLYSAN